ncbi:hypothetical protein [Rhizobium phage RHEph18]|uniref:hypothetical protein n=1 Tax=Rhizobium TaxID=379 RepID=UPI0007EABCFF|nr:MULTISPECIES: hypothetical protein [Rhizobium]ANL02664.1 hypothetical protein AMJ99_CH01077 [Rhizobium esperanzae]ANM33516.1 hypothetical protein AMK04_CH01078 [Rhizobium sp. N871]QIG73748.1 hypothetical protein EVC05_056 [Rhizobium phage RHph_N2]QXV74466.1 hypothetical protein [Rhizobium phage RHEph18]
MSEIKTTGGPAFPGNYSYLDGMPSNYEGMTLRDWFAGQVLCGFMSAKAMHFNPDDDAAYCYRVADAMLNHKFATDPKPRSYYDEDRPF